jgi:hypothetical protein
VKVKKDGGDSWLPVEYEGEEVEGVIIAGGKIIAEASLVGAEVLVRGNYISSKTT